MLSFHRVFYPMDKPFLRGARIRMYTEEEMSKPEHAKTDACPTSKQTPCVRDARQFVGRRKWGTSEPDLNKVVILKALAIRSGQTIVDAGCGDGYMAQVFARALQGAGTVYAIDQATPDVMDGEQEPEAATICPVAADLTGVIPLPSGFIDLIYLSSVFHIFDEDQARGFMREVKRLLKPGGRLAIVDMVKRPTPIGPPLDMRRSPEELREMIDLAPAGLVEVGAYFYMQIFRKEG
jgi:SAM-dependent methyltransferase